MSYRTEIVKRGRPPRFKTAKDIWKEFLAYIEFCDRFPIDLPTHVVKGNKREEGKGGQVRRPLTLDGFITYCGIGQMWKDFARHQRDRGEEFSAVIARIYACVRDDQIAGGVAGIYNSNITARLNGLVDKKDVTSAGGQLDLKFEIVKAKDGKGK